MGQIDREITGANRRLAQWRMKWLIEHSTTHQLLWYIDSFVLRNRQLLIAAKRYLQAKKTTRTINENSLEIVWNNYISSLLL